MTTTATNRWLDALAEKHRGAEGRASDYRLAQLLGLHRQQLSGYRTKGIQMDDDIAVRVADLLEINAMKIVGEIRSERSRTARAKEFWTKAAKAARGKVAEILMGLAVMMTALFGGAAPQRADASALSARDSAPRMYIMLNRTARSRRPKPRWWRWFFWFPIHAATVTSDRFFPAAAALA